MTNNTEVEVEATVRCSIILTGGNDSSRLSAYLRTLARMKLSGSYEPIIINDQRLQIDQRQLRALLPALKVLNPDRPLRQEQSFDTGAMAAKGKYLLLVKSLLSFDKLVLEESIEDLETSGEKASISANENFALVERLHYATVGGFRGLFGGSDLATAQGLGQTDGTVDACAQTVDRIMTAQSRAPSGEAITANCTAGATLCKTDSLSTEEQFDREWQYKYFLLREPKVRGGIPHTDAVGTELQLKTNNFMVRDLVIDVADYWKYIEAAELYKLKRYYGGYDGSSFPEKSLEHYLAAKLLKLEPDDIYVDVGSMQSPVVQVYHNLYRCKTYQQDLSYPAGINGDMIGGDAGAMPVPDGFATKMGLHCSFEHFERDSDIRFIVEAGRVLRPGGRVCILPLYLFSHYAIQTDPAVLPEGGIEFGPDAVLYCKKGYRNRHGRFYDVPHLISRVRNALNGLGLIIYSVTNAQQVHPSCSVRFIAVLDKNSAH